MRPPLNFGEWVLVGWMLLFIIAYSGYLIKSFSLGEQHE